MDNNNNLNTINAQKNKNFFNISTANLSMRPQKMKQKISMSTITPKNQNEQIIDDIMRAINYRGPVDKLVSHIKVLKNKEDLGNFISDNFGSEDNKSMKLAFKNAAKFMSEAEEKEKEYKNEISMYQNLCEELLRRNQDKINSDELKDYFNEIYKVKNLIEQYEE